MFPSSSTAFTSAAATALSPFSVCLLCLKIKLRSEMRDRRSRGETDSQSFSSTLLDKIYRSIDDGENETGRPDLRFYRETTMRWKQNRGTSRTEEEEEVHREKQIFTKSQRKCHLDHDHHRDFGLFSSNSSSSDSSSCGFSSSDSEPKLTKTGKTEQIQSTLFLEQSGQVLIKSKSRAMKIYSNLKKVRQQSISPRLGNFINSLFTNTSSSKKPSKNSINDEITQRTEQATTCSSVSSYHRSCLSKKDRDKLRNPDTKRVRFNPVSVIVDEDCRPCGHRRLYGEAEGGEESRRIEEIVKKLHESEMKKQMVRRRYREVEEEDDGDDVASCCSSDLFELDHLSFAGNGGMYCEELPVYETTHLGKNLAIANGFMM